LRKKEKKKKKKQENDGNNNSLQVRAQQLRYYNPKGGAKKISQAKRDTDPGSWYSSPTATRAHENQATAADNRGSSLTGDPVKMRAFTVL
jgi:hypothetical protein